MKISRSVLSLVAVLVLAGGVGSALIVRQRAQLQQNNQAQLFAKIEQTDLQVEITTSGTVQPLKTVNLSPKTAGILMDLRVEQGDFVEAGDLIAQMDDRDLQAQRLQLQASLEEAQARLAELEAGTRQEEIAQAEAQIAQIQARIAESQARLTLAQERLVRNKQLFQEGAIAADDQDASQTEVDQARATLRQNQAQLQEAERQLEQRKNGPRAESIAQARAQVKGVQAQLAALGVQLEDTQIRAPFAGIITQRYADPGAFVTPTTSASSTASATSTSIVALAQGLEILAKVPEIDLKEIYLGQPVNIVADSYPDQVFQGTVRLIAPEAVKEQNVTSFEVRIALVTGAKTLQSGMNVDVTFLGEVLRSVVVAPTVAIVTLNGQTGVLVPNHKNLPQFKAVVIGTTIGNQTEILEGIPPGDPIFVDLPPGFKLEDALPESEKIR